MNQQLTTAFPAETAEFNRRAELAAAAMRPHGLAQSAPIYFVGKETANQLVGERERSYLNSFYTRVFLDAMAYDDEGNEYALELSLRRVRIINSQNG